MKTIPEADRLGTALLLALRELRDEAVALHNEARLVTDVNVFTLSRLLLDTQAFALKLRAAKEELTR